MASASASLLKSSLVLDKSEWVKGQTLRQPSVSVVRCHPTAPSALTIRAGSYADELVKTAVSQQYIKLFSFIKNLYIANIFQTCPKTFIANNNVRVFSRVYIENCSIARAWNFGDGRV